MIRAGLLLLLTGSLWAQESASRKSLKFPLTKTLVKKGALRPGIGVQGEIPATALQAKVAGEPILFLDLNADDVLSAETDGMSMIHGPFVVPIPETLLLKIGQFQVAFDGTKHLLLAPEDLGAAQAVVAEASLMTEIRVRSALRPAAIDPKASADCGKHIEYLKLNGMIDGSAGMLLHKEVPGKPGYTVEGAAAGAGGDIFPQAPSLRFAIQGWYQTVWHAVPMVDPSLTKFGVATKYNMAVLFFNGLVPSSGNTLPYPPDGAVGIPRSFGENGELPNPVPGTSYGRGCGLPMFVRGGPPVEFVTMTDPAGKSVAGTMSSPAKPATPEWPSNSGVAAFIPSKPLAPLTTYKVSFKYSGGMEPTTWSFTTAK